MSTAQFERRQHVEEGKGHHPLRHELCQVENLPMPLMLIVCGIDATRAT